jgi:hypothetical protein
MLRQSLDGSYLAANKLICVANLCLLREYKILGT